MQIMVLLLVPGSGGCTLLSPCLYSWSERQCKTHGVLFVLQRDCNLFSKESIAYGFCLSTCLPPNHIELWEPLKGVSSSASQTCSFAWQELWTMFCDVLIVLVISLPQVNWSIFRLSNVGPYWWLVVGRAVTDCENDLNATSVATLVFVFKCKTL